MLRLLLSEPVFDFVSRAFCRILRTLRTGYNFDLSLWIDLDAGHVEPGCDHGLDGPRQITLPESARAARHHVTGGVVPRRGVLGAAANDPPLPPARPSRTAGLSCPST